MEPIRVLIADDHPVFRRGLCALLGSVPDIEVLGEAATGDETVAQAAALQPDVILMDIQMSGLNGIEATRHILRTSPHIGILVLTMFEDNASIVAAMRAEARGYLLKGADKVEILRAIKAVDSGEAIFSRTVAQWLMQYFATLKPDHFPQVFPELTEREREILTPGP
jgi:DNA-binding NarL/FixJ family response regulator